MRISASTKSKYYDEELVPRISVYLDGKKVDEVVEVDDDEGWVRCMRKDWVKNYKQGLTIHEKVYGKVEIKIKQGD